MERVQFESFGLFCPAFADVFERGQAFQGLQSSRVIVGHDEIGQMASQLVMAFVIEALDGCLLEGPVHAFDLTIGPWMFGLGQPMIDVGERASILKSMRPEGFAARHHLLDLFGGPGAAGRIGEVDAIVGQNGVDFVGHGLDEGPQEVGGHPCRCLGMQLRESKLRCSVDGDEEIELALGSADLGDVDVEKADRIGLEFLLCRLAALDIGQPADAMALQAAMQR